MAVEVKVEKLKPVKDRGSLRAFVDLRIGRTLFRSWRIIQEEGKRPWVSPPVESWETKDGERRYKRLIVLPPELYEQVQSCILKAWKGGVLHETSQKKTKNHN
jgi:hypothetical protein